MCEFHDHGVGTGISCYRQTMRLISLSTLQDGEIIVKAASLDRTNLLYCNRMDSLTHLTPDSLSEKRVGGAEVLRNAQRI